MAGFGWYKPKKKISSVVTKQTMSHFLSFFLSVFNYLVVYFILHYFNFSLSFICLRAWWWIQLIWYVVFFVVVVVNHLSCISFLDSSAFYLLFLLSAASLILWAMCLSLHGICFFNTFICFFCSTATHLTWYTLRYV